MNSRRGPFLALVAVALLILPGCAEQNGGNSGSPSAMGSAVNGPANPESTVDRPTALEGPAPRFDALATGATDREPERDTPAASAQLTAGNSHESARLRGVSAAGIVLDERLDRLLSRADLSQADLTNAKLHGGASAFQHTRFSNARLTGVSLAGDAASFQIASFDQADLTAAHLTGGVSSFQSASFDGAKLGRARLFGSAGAFQQASFVKASLRNAELVGRGMAFQLVTFDDADLTNAKIVCEDSAFQEARIGGTRFQKADLSALDAQSLASCRFGTANPPQYDKATRFPKGFDAVRRGWKLVPAP